MLKFQLFYPDSIYLYIIIIRKINYVTVSWNGSAILYEESTFSLFKRKVWNFFLHISKFL